jgi:hypothetical protein
MILCQLELANGEASLDVSTKSWQKSRAAKFDAQLLGSLGQKDERSESEVGGKKVQFLAVVGFLEPGSGKANPLSSRHSGAGGTWQLGGPPQAQVPEAEAQILL